MLGFSERIYLWGWALLWGEPLSGWRLLLLISSRPLGWESHVPHRGSWWGRSMRGRTLVPVPSLVPTSIHSMWRPHHVLSMPSTTPIAPLFIISAVSWLGSFTLHLRLKRITMRFKTILLDEVKMGSKIWLSVFNLKSTKFVLTYVSKINP